MITKARRLYVLYQNGGLQEVKRGVVDYMSDWSYQDRRQDNEMRWEFIENHMGNSTSLLDIGCAEGLFTERAASRGLTSIGIDIDEDRVEKARQRSEFGASYMTFEIDPDTVKLLPHVDVILLLTVHHHWADAYGQEGVDMIEDIMERCDILIYEPPGFRTLEGEELNPEKSIEYYVSMFSNYDVEIESSTLVDHMEDSERAFRQDPLMAIDTSGVL